MTTPSSNLPALVAQQKPRLWIFGVLLGLAGLAFLFTEQIASVINIAAVSVQLAALAITFGVLAGAFSAIRCPHCGLRLVLYAMSHKGVGEWLQWLLDVQTCPKCGQSGRVKIE